jgi:uncharacterized protein YjbJ (UPF0337 family)
MLYQVHLLPEFHLTIKSDIMNHNVNGYWDQKKEKLKQKYPILTDDDLSFREGKEKEMIEKLGYKMSKTKQELLYIIAAL